MSDSLETTFILAPFEASRWHEPGVPNIPKLPGYEPGSLPISLAFSLARKLSLGLTHGTRVTLAEILALAGPYSERNKRRAVQILLDAGYLLPTNGSPYTITMPGTTKAVRPRPLRAGAGITKDKRQAVWDKTAGCCWYCGAQTTPAALGAPPRPEDFCIEHQTSWDEGGTHHLSNLVPACRHCNSRKGTKSLEAFRALEARRGLPHFTAEHIAYLEKLQIPLPPGFPCYPQITFWGEEHEEVR